MGSANCTMTKNVSVPVRVIRVEHKSIQTRNTEVYYDDYKVKNPNITFLGAGTPELINQIDPQLQERSQKADPTIKKDLKIGEFFLNESITSLTMSTKTKQPPNRQNPKKKKKTKSTVYSKIKNIEAIIAKTKKTLGPAKLQSITDEMYTETDSCIDEFSKRKPIKFHAFLLAGPPMKYRWSLWKAKLNIEKHYVDGLYPKFLNMTTSWEIDIRKDVSRTFPEEIFFAVSSYGFIGQTQLFNVLKAISLYFPNIGYCQGMNFVVGFILLVNGGKELEAFWFFVSLARSHEYMLMGLFEGNWEILNLYLHIFYEVFQRELPHLYEHMKIKEEIPDMVWIGKWLLTLFLYSLPAAQVVRIWDYMISEDIFALVKISLSILKSLEKVLLKLDLAGFNELLKKLNNEKQEYANVSSKNVDLDGLKEIDMDVIISHAKKIKITKAEITQYTKNFLETEQGKGKTNIYYEFYLNFHANCRNPSAIDAFQRNIDAKIIGLVLKEKSIHASKKVRKSMIEHDEEHGNKIIQQMANLRQEESKLEANKPGEDEESQGEVEAEGEEHHYMLHTQQQLIRAHPTRITKENSIANPNDLKQIDSRTPSKHINPNGGQKSDLEAPIYDSELIERQIIRKDQKQRTITELKINA